MDIKDIYIFWCLKDPFATKAKELVTNWPPEKKINLKGFLSINKRSRLRAVIDCRDVSRFSNYGVLWTPS